MISAGRIVFDGNRLRATLFNPQAPRLIVTFRQRITPDGAFTDATPVKRFINHNCAHLHLQSRLNDWYINPETAEFESCLKEISAQYDPVSGIGFSMGGYAAMRFSGALRMQQCILVSPQISISPQTVRWDRRYRDSAAEFDARLGDVASHAQPKMQGVVLADPFRRMDLRHAKLIQSVFPNVGICRLSGGGHPATRVLAEGGRFVRLQRMLISGEVTSHSVISLHRNSRRTSKTYWRHLANTSEKRGKLGVCAHARAKQVEIESSEE